MKVVTLYGYHGHSNLGDDLFLKITLKWLSSNFGVKKAYVNAVKGVLDCNIENVDIVSFDRLNHYIARAQWLRVLIYALRSDALIFSSGSILKIQPFMLMGVVLYLIKLIKGRNFKIIGIGISIGPFKNKFDEKWCIRVLSLFDRLLLRDNRSYHFVEEKLPHLIDAGQITNSYDLALAWPSIKHSSSSSIRLNKYETVGIAINHDIVGSDPAFQDNSLLTCIARLLSDWQKRKPSRHIMIIVVCNDPKDGDYAISKSLHDQLKLLNATAQLYVHRSMDVDNTILQLASCNALFASRMHAGLLAMFNGVPVLQFSYASKIADFYQRLTLSTENLCVDRARIIDRLRNFLANDFHSMDDIDLIVHDCRARLIEQIRVLGHLFH